MTNHPNRAKHQRGAQCIYRYMTARELDRAIDTQADLLVALTGLLNCFNSNGEIEETTQDQLSVALENAEKAQAKAEGR